MEPTRQLNEREQIILNAVVHMFVTTAEPVGSRVIVKRFELDLSPATVRNVMADLEEAGYLTQLHTSSGRIPTSRGYRYYVDYLMRVHELTLGERRRIEAELSDKLNDADIVMRQTCQLLALVSQQAGIVEAPHEGDAIVRSIELMPLSSTRLALLVADSFGRVRTGSVMAEPMPENVELERLRRYLNDNLRGVPLEHMSASLQSRIETHLGEERFLAARAMELLLPFPLHRQGQLFLEGTTQLFDQPEFHDLDRAREVMSFLDERERLLRMLRTGLQDNPSKQMVMIGANEHGEGLQEISVVASPYFVGEKAVGMLGVLGPRRMPYPRLTALVDYTAKMVGKLLTRLAG